MTSDRIDVIVTDPTIIHEDVFEMWLTGLSAIKLQVNRFPKAYQDVCFIAEETAKCLQSQPSVEVFSLSLELITSSVTDQFAEFTLFEQAMQRPDIFICYPTHCILDVESKKKLVELYYSLDENLCRELIGSKLSTRFRRDLLDVSEKVGIRPRSCRRQYENLRRVARFVEDAPGRLCEIIRKYFVLPQPLADLYAAMIFLSANRFEASKRCFTGVTFTDFAYCADQLMTYWTNSCNKEVKCDSPVDLELDFEFCDEVKALKLLTEKQTYFERHKSLVLRQLSTSVSPNCLSGIETHFKNISKAIITIAIGLSHSREVRDLFVDIVEKIIEVVAAAEWTNQEFTSFLTSFDETLRVLPPAKSSSFQRCWKRFFTPLKSIIHRLYRIAHE